MSTLFIIGNGFDLSCGAKTSYVDAYKAYKKTPSKSSIIEEFKNKNDFNSETWGDYEIAMGDYAEKFENEAEFVECVRDFSIFLTGYLKDIDEEYSKKIKEMGVISEIHDEMSKFFDDFCRGITPNIDYEMEERGACKLSDSSIISLNYTKIFDEMTRGFIQINSRGKPIIHIHGTLEEGIVMGVNSVELINSTFQITPTGERAFVKPILNRDYNQRRVDEAIERIEMADTICVFGATMGNSDLMWRNKIIDWLKNSKYNRLFVYSYKSESIEGMTPDHIIENEIKEKRDLIEKWGIDEELFDQIHIQCRKDLFNIKKVFENRKNKKKEDDEEEKRKQKMIEEHILRNRKRPTENGVGFKSLGILD